MKWREKRNLVSSKDEKKEAPSHGAAGEKKNGNGGTDIAIIYATYKSWTSRTLFPSLRSSCIILPSKLSLHRVSPTHFARYLMKQNTAHIKIQ